MNIDFLRHVECLLDKGDRENARAEIEKVAANHPESAVVTLGQALLRLDAEEYEQAVEATDRVDDGGIGAGDAGMMLVRARIRSEALLGLERYEDALSAAEDAIAAGQDLKDDRWEVKVLGSKLVAIFRLQRYEDALAVTDALVGAAIAAEDKETEGDALYGRSIALQKLERYEEALGAAEIAAEAARQADDNLTRAYALQAQAEALRGLRRYDEAPVLAAQAVDIMKELGKPNKLAPALLELGIALADAGRSAERDDVLQQLEELPEKLSEQLRYYPLLATLRDYPTRPGWATRVARMLKRKTERERNLRELLHQKPETTALTSDAIGGICVLRKWASYTSVDMLRSGQDEEPGGPASSGGGYFLWWQGWGLVIDPGLGFGAAFRDAGFVPQNIDAVVATHHHIDHTGDMLPLVTCLFEMHDDKVEHVIDFYLAPGAFSAFANLLAYTPGIRSVKLLRPNETSLIKSKGAGIVRITSVKARHRDLTGREDAAVGLVLNLALNDEPHCFVGLTGDTCYFEGLAAPFVNVQLLIAHVGSVYPQDIGELDAEPPWHLGISGTIQLLKDVKEQSSNGWDPLIILSEWGEELAGDRTEICQVVSEATGLNRVWLAEMGARIALLDYNAQPMCAHCPDKFASVWHTDGNGDITYVCQQHFHNAAPAPNSQAGQADD